jgi:ferredoxin
MKYLHEGKKFLAVGGLNLLAVLDCAALPEAAAEIMEGSGVPLGEYRRLVLIGHGGRRMWEALQERGMETSDPVDYYSISLTRQFIRDYLENAPVQWLYPDTVVGKQGSYWPQSSIRPKERTKKKRKNRGVFSEFVIPLQQLGEAAGWSYPSPLGSGISPVYGVWFAYRAAFLIDADLPLVYEEPAPAPCDSCLDKPCIQSCPVGAAQPGAFDIEGCAGHRLGPDSPCADRCLARMACPYFPEQRYSLEQIRYHYGRSLESLRAWYGVNDE